MCCYDYASFPGVGSYFGLRYGATNGHWLAVRGRRKCVNIAGSWPEREREACVLESDLEEEANFFHLWWDWMSFERIGNLSFDILRSFGLLP